MSNELNESGPSRPKHICMSPGYKIRLEQMLFESNDKDFDLLNIVIMKYYNLYIYNMTPIGVKQPLSKNLFSDANDANRWL